MNTTDISKNVSALRNACTSAATSARSISANLCAILIANPIGALDLCVITACEGYIGGKAPIVKVEGVDCEAYDLDTATLESRLNAWSKVMRKQALPAGFESNLTRLAAAPTDKLEAFKSAKVALNNRGLTQAEIPTVGKAGAKAKVATVDAAKADATPVEIVSLMDMLMVQRTLRATLMKMTSSQEVADAFDNFIATIAMECKVKVK
jgi:hypothetical protein